MFYSILFYFVYWVGLVNWVGVGVGDRWLVCLVISFFLSLFFSYFIFIILFYLSHFVGRNICERKRYTELFGNFQPFHFYFFFLFLNFNLIFTFYYIIFWIISNILIIATSQSYHSTYLQKQMWALLMMAGFISFYLSIYLFFNLILFNFIFLLG